MLDPLTALQTASAVVQLVDFSINVVGSAHEIYKGVEGATQSTIHLKGVASHLQSLCNKVVQTHDTASAAQGGNGDNQLRDIAARCHDAAQEILQMVDTLQIDRTQQFQSWQALRKAIRGYRKAGELDAMQRRMDSLRGELTLHLLYMMK